MKKKVLTSTVPLSLVTSEEFRIGSKLLSNLVDMDGKIDGIYNRLERACNDSSISEYVRNIIIMLRDYVKDFKQRLERHKRDVFVFIVNAKSLEGSLLEQVGNVALVDLKDKGLEVDLYGSKKFRVDSEFRNKLSTLNQTDSSTFYHYFNSDYYIKYMTDETIENTRKKGGKLREPKDNNGIKYGSDYFYVDRSNQTSLIRPLIHGDLTALNRLLTMQNDPAMKDVTNWITYKEGQEKPIDKFQTFIGNFLKLFDHKLIVTKHKRINTTIKLIKFDNPDYLIKPHYGFDKKYDGSIFNNRSNVAIKYPFSKNSETLRKTGVVCDKGISTIHKADFIADCPILSRLLEENYEVVGYDADDRYTKEFIRDILKNNDALVTTLEDMRTNIVKNKDNDRPTAFIHHNLEMMKDDFSISGYKTYDSQSFLTTEYRRDHVVYDSINVALHLVKTELIDLEELDNGTIPYLDLDNEHGIQVHKIPDTNNLSAGEYIRNTLHTKSDYVTSLDNRPSECSEKATHGYVWITSNRTTETGERYYSKIIGTEVVKIYPLREVDKVGRLANITQEGIYFIANDSATPVLLDTKIARRQHEIFSGYAEAEAYLKAKLEVLKDDTLFNNFKNLDLNYKDYRESLELKYDITKNKHEYDNSKHKMDMEKLEIEKELQLLKTKGELFEIKADKVKGILGLKKELYNISLQNIKQIQKDNEEVVKAGNLKALLDQQKRDILAQIHASTSAAKGIVDLVASAKKLIGF